MGLPLGRGDAAIALLEQLAQSPGVRESSKPVFAWSLLLLVRTAIQAGDIDLAVELHGDAATRWEAFGRVVERALALLGNGRCLRWLGRPADAEAILREARSVFPRLHAAPYLAKIHALLARSSTRGSASG